jgi:hypothetical protein
MESNFLPTHSSSLLCTNLRCLQINLHHSKLVSANLSQLVPDLSIDIVLIQEPYTISGPSPTLANVSPRYAAFHALSSDHAYGATILLRQTIADSGRVKLMHRANHSECIEVSSRFGTYRFMSLYLRSSLVNFCDSLNELFTELASPCSIFGIDANAKSLLWNSNRTDPKGVNLESLVLMHKLNFINVNKQHLEFIPDGIFCGCYPCW